MIRLRERALQTKGRKGNPLFTEESQVLFPKEFKAIVTILKMDPSHQYNHLLKEAELLDHVREELFLLISLGILSWSQLAILGLDLDCIEAFQAEYANEVIQVEVLKSPEAANVAPNIESATLAPDVDSIIEFIPLKVSEGPVNEVLHIEWSDSEDDAQYPSYKLENAKLMERKIKAIDDEMINIQRRISIARQRSEEMAKPNLHESIKTKIVEAANLDRDYEVLLKRLELNLLRVTELDKVKAAYQDELLLTRTQISDLREKFNFLQKNIGRVDIEYLNATKIQQADSARKQEFEAKRSALLEDLEQEQKQMRELISQTEIPNNVEIEESAMGLDEIVGKEIVPIKRRYFEVDT